MPISIRSFLKHVIGLTRTPTYYLPFLTRSGRECALILSNIEARFRPGSNRGPFPISIVQYDTDGTPSRRYTASLRDCTDTVELSLVPTAGGCGFVTVEGELESDLYVTLCDSEMYTATHGRGEFIERYPLWTRALMAVVGGALALTGRTIPAVARNQYVYIGRENRSHLILLNLSNVTNRIRASLSRDGELLDARLVSLSPMGAHLLDMAILAPPPGDGTTVYRLRLEGNAWFNLYLVGAGPRDLAGPLSLMHVK